MRIVGTVGGLALAFMGVVWMLQGFNASYVPQSFMTASPLWIVIGAATLVGGLALVRRSWNHR